MANHTLYIATGSQPFSSQFQEMLDMLLTGAAFGQATTLWLTPPALATLKLCPNDTLMQLADFGVRCVTEKPGREENAPPTPCPVSADPLGHDELLSLRTQCDQILVF
ncbi:hypothetical protein [Alcanivorax sp.]|uniref:hypothetical protein n=1 Tax=Alcanivorax sp. TaxID=1872427 RepID=UPI000C106F64|nr:hypothetical protein [Alcanivorax sp.]PHR68023.1 MAG: hypothetical protein COA55_03895 [Alcanivorax sp.]